MNRRRGPSSVVFGSATVAVTRLPLPTSAPQHSCGYVSSPCRRISPSIVSLTISLVIPELLGQIFFGAVRTNGHDDARFQILRHLQDRGDRRARRYARHHAFFAREPAYHVERIFTFDAQ